LDGNINTVKRKPELDANKGVGIEVNTRKTKCMSKSHYQKNVAKFKYFGTAEMNQNYIYEEIKGR
jgi:hypothetical protein